MTVRAGAADALPTSHVFITFARGRWTRTVTLRSGLVLLGLAVLPVLAIWLVVATAYLAFHDDVVASLMLRQRDMQYDYEDRIATLRAQIDRASTRELLTQRSITAKLDELTTREADLQTRSGILSHLDEQVTRVFGAAGVGEAPAATRAPPPHAAHADLAPLFAGGPVASAADPAAEVGTPPTERLARLSTELDLIRTAQEDAVATLDRKVKSSTTRYRDALSATGLSLDRLAGVSGESGGPFVPLAREDDATPFARSTVGVQLSLSEAARLSSVVARVPLNQPLRGDPNLTSSFGPRIDPFLGRPAMHTGVDLAEESGTDVLATASGRVSIAGQASGYGLMVEVDHGAGLATRYAHLSEASVAVGQQVKSGDVIGHVGSSGRATGPHLHYETRIDGEAVDPIRFLAAGHLLFGKRD